MSHSKATWSFVSGAALAIMLSVGCGSGTSATGANQDGGASGGPDGKAGHSGSSGCTTDKDCMAKLPATTPPDCATATCNALEGTCSFAAKDTDNDGHTAFNCKANSGNITIVVGDDCNDSDSNIYPGHPEACSTGADGGAPPADFCTGQRVCNADGTESGCQVTLSCPNQACVSRKCVSGCYIGGMMYASGAPNPMNACQTCEPGVSSSAWTNGAAGASCGNGQLCSLPDSGTGGATCGSQCDIAGVVVASGAMNPANPGCQTCQPGTSTTTWSNATDGATCTAAGLDSGGAQQYCSGGVCSDGCFISGMFYAAGAANPAALACQACIPSETTTAWSNVPDGKACQGGGVCAAGLCQMECDVAGMLYTEGTIDPANPCLSCQYGTSATAWTGLPDGTACGMGVVCIESSCTAGCFAGGVVYQMGAANAGNACQTCQPATSTTMLTSVADGASCGNGQVCSMGQCGTQCDIGGTIYGSGTLNPANPCQSCQPGVSTTAWSGLADGTTGCPTGQVCISASCTADCYIGGTKYAANALNPGNPCTSCQPSMTTTAFSTVAEGTSCGVAQVCNGATCAQACFIAGVIYVPAQANPANPCQECEPATATTAWSNEANGTNCGNGEVCAAGACGSQCVVGGTTYPSGTLNPANSCQSCQPGVATSSFSPLPTGTACGAGEVCGGTSTCALGCFIAGTLYTPNQLNPGNPCQSCQPGVSTTAWTTLASGTSCGIGDVCQGASCIAGCAIAGVVYTANTVNPANPCQSCQPSMNTLAWTNLAAGSCGSDGTCSAGNCLFAYSGSPQTLTVPAGVTHLAVTISGAAGASSSVGTIPGGNGGSVTASIPVTPGETLTIHIGGVGGPLMTGGYNGGAVAGGAGFTPPLASVGGGGGGASDICQGGSALANRVIVAAGGGGAGGDGEGAPVSSGGVGGAGGNATGGTGGAGGCAGGGKGGTAAAGGAGGTCKANGVAGTLGTGGAGIGGTGGGGGGGGGGGYYGGGGGGVSNFDDIGGSGGGGGSSYAEATATGVVMMSGVQSGSGQVLISF